jgi:hypothetical protein
LHICNTSEASSTCLVRSERAQPAIGHEHIRKEYWGKVSHLPSMCHRFRDVGNGRTRLWHARLSDCRSSGACFSSWFHTVSGMSGSHLLHSIPRASPDPTYDRTPKCSLHGKTGKVVLGSKCQGRQKGGGSPCNLPTSMLMSDCTVTCCV